MKGSENASSNFSVANCGNTSSGDVPESSLLVLDPLAAYLMAKIELNIARDVLAIHG